MPKSKKPQRSGESLARDLAFALLIAILAYAALIRVYDLPTSPPGLYGDEAVNGNNILEALETGKFQVFYPENYGREGFFINLGAIPVYFIGNEAWALRLPSAIFGTLTVWAVYLLGAELLPIPVALAAAFLTATSFWHLVFSRLAFRAISSPFFLALSLFLLARTMRRLSEGKSWMGWIIAAGAVYGLGFHTYIAYRTTPVLVAALLFYYYRKTPRRLFWNAVAIFSGVAAIVFLPLGVYFLRHPGSFTGRISKVSITVPILFQNIGRTAGMFFFHGDENWRHNISGRPELFWPVAIFFAAGIVFGIGHIVRERRKLESWFVYAFLMGWIALGALPAILSDEAPHALRTLPMIPAVFLLAGAGAWQLWKLADRIPVAVRAVALVALAGWLGYEPWDSCFNKWAHTPETAQAMDNEISVMAARVRRMRPDADKFVMLGWDPSEPVNYGQPLMFLTRSYTARQREQSKIHYVYWPTPAGKGPERCREFQQQYAGQISLCIFQAK